MIVISGGQGQICKLKYITDSSQKVAHFLFFNDLAYTFLLRMHNCLVIRLLAVITHMTIQIKILQNMELKKIPPLKQVTYDYNIYHNQDCYTFKQRNLDVKTYFNIFFLFL